MEAITAVKAAAVAAKNKDKIGKYIGIVVAISVTPILLIIALYLYVMSAFTSDGLLRSADYFNGTDSAIHKSLQEVLEPYYTDMKKDMLERKNKIKKEKINKYKTKDATGKEIEKEIEPVVTQKINYVPENVIIAYLIMIDGMDVESAKVDKNVVEDFLDAVNEIEEIDEGTYSGINFWRIENKILSVDKIADKYFGTESEKKQFVVTCNAYGEYFDVATTSVLINDNGYETTESPIMANLSSVPLYLQYDTTWGTLPYGNGTIKRNGCCPTSLAMVFSYLCQQNIYPNDVVAWAGNRYYVNGQGTAWSIFTPAAEHWGVTCTSIGKDQSKMKQALSEGKLIIASMGPGTFTKGGHFIVLTGITATGKIKVNDPNDSAVKKHIEKEFDVSLILRECKNMWVFGR